MSSPIVVIISSDIEWRIICNILINPLSRTSPFGQYFENFDTPMGHDVIFFQGGWGKIAAAASTQYAIERWKPALIVNIGTCGGFRGLVEKGAILLAERTIVYDIVEQMGSFDEALAHYVTAIDLSWLTGPFPQKIQRTVLVSGDRDVFCGDIEILHQEYGAIAADWESGAIAWVSSKNNIKTLILRGVSDLVSGSGAEAYHGNIKVFENNAESILKELMVKLPEWINRSNL